MTRPKTAFYAGSVQQFLALPSESIVVELRARAVPRSKGDSELLEQQVRAWERQVPLLRVALTKIPQALPWGLVLEYSLHRMGRRPDAVLLAPGVIVVIEFKMGATRHSAAGTDQVVDYALCIRDFHGSARRYIVAPLICAEAAPNRESHRPLIIDGAAEVILSNAADLSRDLRMAISLGHTPRALTWRAFSQGLYSPTPNIVEAARALYQKNAVAEIGRADSSGQSRLRTTERLKHWVLEARRRKKHVICLVTGSPGSGKSLLGLNLTLSEKYAGRVEGEPAALLTGNRPLVHVLKEALIQDAKDRGGDSKDNKRALDGALQTLMGYLRQHTGKRAAAPPERVIVFDEAQRAWDEKTGKKYFDRPSSEPELFLEILHRLDWACLVCLIGAGQEINVGEGGIQLWERALEKEADFGHAWHIVCADPALLNDKRLRIEVDRSLHLSGSFRSYRNPRHVKWVDALLAGQIQHAARIAKDMWSQSQCAPALITRSLTAMKRWLTRRRRGNRRIGLLVSSAASPRLRAEDVHAPPTSGDLPQIERWFLKSYPEFSSSDSLEIPMSEFGCQGLELDYVGLAWGGDLVWATERAQWEPRKLRASRWTQIHDEANAQFRANTYRVLLTRAREGVCIFVPIGSHSDETRSAVRFNKIAQVLIQAGCQEISSEAL